MLLFFILLSELCQRVHEFTLLDLEFSPSISILRLSLSDGSTATVNDVNVTEIDQVLVKIYLF